MTVLDSDRTPPPAAEPAQGGVRGGYHAFISYSHAADDRLAPALQRALQRLAKPWYRLPLLRVFRDKTSLAANPALWPSIVQALEQSAWFVYLASPQAAASRWVQQELQWWLAHRSCDRLLIVLTGGDLVWDGAGQDFDLARSPSIPALLAGRFAAEPLHVDLRWAAGQDALSLRHSQFRAAVLDIAAPLHGRPKDQLDGDDVRQHRNARRLAWTGGAALAVLTLVATFSAVVAVRESRIAETRRQVAQSRQIAAQSAVRLAEHRLDAALLLALEAGQVMAPPVAAQGSNDFDWRHRLLSALSEPTLPVARHLHGGGGLASTDGRLLATADGTVITLWDLAGGRALGRLEGHADAVLGLALSRDGRTLVSSSRSGGNLVVWDLVRQRMAFEPLTVHGGSAVTVAISPDGRTLATGGGDQAVQLWHLAEGQPPVPAGAPLAGHTSNVVSLAFSADGRWLASGSWDGTVRLYDRGTAPAGPPVVARVLSMSRSQVEHVAFSPDGQLLAAGGGEGVVLWSVPEGRALGEPLPHPGGVQAVAFSTDGRLLASGGDDGQVRLWRVEDRQPAASPLRAHQRWIEGLAFLPGERRFFSGGADGLGVVWDLAARPLLRLDAGPAPAPGALAQAANGWLAQGVCADAAAAHTSVCRESGIRFTAPGGGAPQPLMRSAFPAVPNSLVFVDQGKLLLSASCAAMNGSDCTGVAVETWHPRTGKLDERVMRDSPGGRRSVLAISPDGAFVAAGGCRLVVRGEDCDSGEIQLWHTATGQPVGPAWSGHRRGVIHLAFSPDGRRLASGTQDDVMLWDVPGGRALGRPLAGSQFAFSPDGRLLATAEDRVGAAGRIVLRDSSTLQLQGEWSLPARETTGWMAWSPDQRTLAVTTSDETGPGVSLWDVRRGERLGPVQRWGNER